MDADKANARARAEARRAKILAKQKDRLTSITGVYSKPQDAVPEPEAGPLQEPDVVPRAASSINGSSQQEAQQQQQQLQQCANNQQQVEALMSVLEQQLRHAQAMQASLALPQQPPSPAAASPNQQSSSGNAAPLEALFSAPDQNATGTAQEQQPQQQHMHLLLQMGPALSWSAKQTQMVRLLAAVLLVYAVLSDWQLGFPPVLLLMATNLAVVLAGAAFLPAKSAATSSVDGVQLPWRLRSMDVLSLVPGLREVMTAVSGYNAVATALSQDFAAYIVVLGLVVACDVLPAGYSAALQL